MCIRDRRRIPFDRQIVAQAPPGAAGYRLVFPTGARGETIRIAPTIEPSGALSYWSLAPFQLPDDLRIQDGHSYRILWVDGLGRPLAPQGTTHLPALHAFLGPPDAEATAEDARYASMLRDITSPELRAKAEAAVLESRLAEIRLQQNEVLLKQSIAMSDATARSEKSAAETAQQIRKEQREAQAISDAQREKKAAASAIEYARIDKRNQQILATDVYKRQVDECWAIAAICRDGLAALGCRGSTDQTCRIAVSYTHLDVYKRQPLTRGASKLWLKVPTRPRLALCY